MITGHYLPRERIQTAMEQMEQSLKAQKTNPLPMLKEGEIARRLAEKQPFYDAYEAALEEQLPKMGIRRHDGGW